MKPSSCCAALRVCLFALITVGVATPAAAQSITVISPHEGEQVRSYNFYMVRWDASGIPADGSFYVYTLSDWDGGERLICTAPASARACDWSEPYATERGTLFIQGRDGSGTPLVTVESGRFQTVNNTLPIQFNHFDIGAVARSGHSWADPDGTIRVRGSGADIWGTADAFQFAYMENWWDMSARVTLTGIEGTHPWTKAGLMLRESFQPGAVHHYVLVSKDRGVAYQRRVTTGGESLHTSLSASSALPVTLEVMRRAGYVEMNVRRGDGPWERAAGFEVDGPRLLGLAVTSHDNAVLADGVFTDVQFEDAHGWYENVYIYSPEPREVVAAGVPYTISWTHEQPVNVATVSLSVDGGATWSVIPGCQAVTGTTCQWMSPGPTSESARIRVDIHDPDDRDAWTASWPFRIRAIESGPLPQGWGNRDIGHTGAAGSAAYDPSTGRFTIEGAGADIWGTADAFHFASTRMLNSPWSRFEVTARVTSVEHVHRWVKAGIMVRAHLGANAAHASFFATPSTERGIAFQRRPSDGAESVHTAGPAFAPPVWLKLVVDGTIRAYYRKTTQDPWTLLGEQAIQAGSTLEVGLAVSSHVHGTLARAIFDEVSVRYLYDLQEQDIGAVGVPGSSEGDRVNITMRASGDDIWNHADAFRYRYMTIDTLSGVSAGVRSIVHTHRWAKAGVMMRENTSPGSRHVMLIVSAGRGVAMQYRATTGGPSADVAIVPGAAPHWVRLVRNGHLFIGEMSSDGVTWQEVGRIELPIAHNMLGGLALTSHNNSVLTTAEFTDVIVR
jgi:hypothetical protein